MNPSKVFEHKGKVAEIGDNLVKIRMTVSEACGACSAKNICGSTSSQERILEITTQNNQFNVGEEVEVIIQQSKGFKAVMLGYLLPAILLILVLMVTLPYLNNETYSALLSLGSVSLYYFVLYLLKGKLKKAFSFTLRKTGI